MMQSEAIKVLGSTTCRCGWPKQRRQAFCGKCYGRLGHDAQRDLYARMGRGFEEAYDRALWILEHQEADAALKNGR